MSFTIFILSLFFIFKTLFLNFYPDFKVHYLSPIAVFSGNNPYKGGENFFTPEVYPPFVIYLFSPFILFSYSVAEKLWTALSIIFLFVSLYFIFKINGKFLFSTTGLLLSALFFTFYFPIKFTLGMGQINFLILFLTVLSVYFLNKNKEASSGFFLTLSMMIKFFPLLLLPYLLLLKKWKMLLSIGITFCTISFFIFLLNPKLTLYFYGSVLPSLLGGWKGDYYNQSLAGFLTREVVFLPLREFMTVLFSLLLVIISFVTIHIRKNIFSNLSVSLLISLSLLINNFSWQHVFVWLSFPFITIFYFIKDQRSSLFYFLVWGASFFLTGLNLPNPGIFPVIFISHVFYGALLLWALNIYLLLKKT